MDPLQLFTSVRYDPQLGNCSANCELNPHMNAPQSNFYMLSYHRDRIYQAAAHFGWDNAQQDLEAFAASITDCVTANLAHAVTERQTPCVESEAFRVKVIVLENGHTDVEINPTPSVALDTLFPQSLDLPQHRKESKPLKISPHTGGGLTLGPHEFIPTPQHGSQPWRVYIDTHQTTPSAFTTYKTTNRSMYDSARSRAGLGGPSAEAEVLLVNHKGQIMEGSMTTPYFRREGRWITPPLSSGGQAGTTRRWALEKGLCVEQVIEAEELEDGEDVWISSGVRGFRRGKIQKMAAGLLR